MFFSLLLLDFFATVFGGCKVNDASWTGDCGAGEDAGIARLVGGAGDLPGFRAILGKCINDKTRNGKRNEKNGVDDIEVSSGRAERQ